MRGRLPCWRHVPRVDAIPIERHEITMNTWADLRRDLLACEKCPRLVAHRQRIATEKRASFRDWTYWGRPVPSLGDRQARLLVVGLAPAAHGANRTGRMFTGDRSGDWLFDAMFRSGFANQAGSVHRRDALRLHDARIAAVAHCAPPANTPTREEILACQPYLRAELQLLRHLKVVVVLGGVALRGFVDAWRAIPWQLDSRPAFGHGRVERLPGGRWLVVSYHPSQQNTFTGRLTRPMLRGVFRTARRLLET
jgi:uracil-DNA glycosylase family 4